MLNKFKTGLYFLLCFTIISGLYLIGCGQPPKTGKPTITFVENDWTSQLIGTEIVAQIAEKQLGYPTARVQTSPTAGWATMSRGDADVNVEIWLPQRQPEIQPFLDKGQIELGAQIFPGGGGWFVPTFVIEGDQARGIAAVAPDLKSILDLKDVDKGGKGYWKLFENPEKPGLGELVGGSPGWTDDPLDRSMIRAYELPLWRSNQSESVMSARMIAADKKGQPLLMYMWWPHWIFAQVDMVKLDEPDPWYEGAFADDTKDYKAGHPAQDVRTVVATALKDKAPDVYRLVKNMVLGEEVANSLMLRVDVDKEDIKAVAADWISNNQSTIDRWLGK